MNLRGIHPGSRVLCNVKGREFNATVKGLTKSQRGYGTTVQIEPDSRNISYRFIGARAIREKLPNGADPETAEYLDGPGFEQWVKEHVERYFAGSTFNQLCGESALRRMREWAKPGFIGHERIVDPILTKLGLHYHDIPEHLWREKPPPRDRGRTGARFTYPEDFKEKAVQRYYETANKRQVSQEMGCSERSVLRWVREAR